MSSAREAGYRLLGSRLDYILHLAPGRRLLYVPTAGMEDTERTVGWYERLRGRAEMTHLHFFPWPPSGLRELTLDHDVILVTGGNTANALAIWRTHGFDQTRDPPGAMFSVIEQCLDRQPQIDPSHRVAESILW